MLFQKFRWRNFPPPLVKNFPPFPNLPLLPNRYPTPQISLPSMTQFSPLLFSSNTLKIFQTPLLFSPSTSQKLGSSSMADPVVGYEQLRSVAWDSVIEKAVAGGASRVFAQIFPPHVFDGSKVVRLGIVQVLTVISQKQKPGNFLMTNATWIFYEAS
ncbi:uncharacterized protein LOC109844034 isoform X2 [Asparagus officinalis]|uniref:uncharacterized protein LOC109844034 isoform X2 n=1 Tax=Asparagus officinalis TaxID=4686 RepID=UPI00098E1C32|nr:uncharacterized protein LOC109844034 isoform X2 [Asparagus officinalis]